MSSLCKASGKAFVYHKTTQMRLDRTYGAEYQVGMEVRDPVHGIIELNRPEVAVLDSAVYQRLRAIKQLGFSEFSFPGATHNRYIHSLGVAHVASMVFDNVFKDFTFTSAAARRRFRQMVRLGALLHDIGHGPLSHTTEQVMPPVKDLNIEAYKNNPHFPWDRQANHEDYTIKFVTDSSLTEILKTQFPDFTPLHIAGLIDKSLVVDPDFYKDGDWDLRVVMSQIVSSELDADRMDYLERDAYFCGTNYGRVELSWLVANLSFHRVDERLHLALGRRALYAFDDFLLSRHHMHLMVYFHHKSIIYEELLHRYLSSADCTYHLPADAEEYIKCTDYSLYEHLAHSSNEWARRISERKPYKMLFELHSNKESERPLKIKAALEAEGIQVIHANSQARLSKYHSGSEAEKSQRIFVVDEYDYRSKPYPLEEATEIFKRYEHTRQIDRLYVPPEKQKISEQILIDKGL
jgi:HD superfamily phosphohydrolase